MKVIVQRVNIASVSVNQNVISQIKKGYVLLVGFKKGDSLIEVEYVARKIANLRIFSDDNDKLNLSIKQVNGEILSISQFTVYGDVNKSNRPSFTESMNFQEAKKLYLEFNEILRNKYQIKVFEGIFGEDMVVSLENDGPVTIIVEK